MAPRQNRSRIAAVALLLAGAVAVAITASDEAEGQRVFAVVPEAANLTTGLEVRAAGDIVGEVDSLTPVRGGRAARIGLRIDDETWPLPQGTKMRLRWGGTIAYNNRYIELRRGPAGAGAIPDGGTVPTSDVTLPVEFDQLLSTFTPAVRRDMKAMMDNGGAAFRAAEGPLRRSLESAPPAVSHASGVLEDFEATSAELDTLVRSADSVVNAAHRADPGLGRLVSGAATTFRATASEAVALRSAMRETPHTLASTRATLRRADFTLRGVGELTDRLAPGVDEIRRLADPLTGLLRSLVRVGPHARSALATVRRATPSLNPLLARLTELMPQIGSMSRQSAEQLKCIRPYSPEIAAYFSTWGDRHNNSDGRGRYGRSVLQGAPFNNAQTDNSAQIAQKNPELTYTYPSPPGLNAGQPWLLPECGVGPDVFDPSKDAEARPFDPASRNPGADPGGEARP